MYSFTNAIVFLNEMATRKICDKGTLQSTVHAVNTKELGYKYARKAFNVPCAVLKDYVKMGGDLTGEELVNKKIDRKPLLPAILENELVSYSMLIEYRFYVNRISFLWSNCEGHPPYGISTCYTQYQKFFFKYEKAAGRKWMVYF
ncbi:hypothetical protein FQA39_LY10398 [Lamprigera yunnana]|nr:hypothetical protein FQA39_LY10398 [Lamprigera yunnana]